MILEVNGIELFYEVKGKGRNLILVHGNGEDHHIFDDLEGMVSIQHACPEIDFPADTPTGSLITALQQCVSCCLE